MELNTRNIDKMLRATYDPSKRMLTLMKVSGQEVHVGTCLVVYHEAQGLTVTFGNEDRKRTIQIGYPMSDCDVMPGYWVQSLKIIQGE